MMDDKSATVSALPMTGQRHTKRVKTLPDYLRWHWACRRGLKVP